MGDPSDDGKVHDVNMAVDRQPKLAGNPRAQARALVVAQAHES